MDLIHFQKYQQIQISLESSSYLNVSLRYLGPWDLGTPGPWNPLTLGLLDLFPPPTPPHTSPYILLPPPISSSYSPPLVWFGYGGRGGCEFWGWDWRWTFEKLWGGWVEPWDLLLLSAFYSSILLPPPSYSFQLLHPPPKPPPNSSYLLLKGLRWLISSYIKRFQCYSAQKSFMGGGGDIQL